MSEAMAAGLSAVVIAASATEVVGKEAWTDMASARAAFSDDGDVPVGGTL